MAIVFTRVSANRVKVDNDGEIMGYCIASTNVFEHPYEDKIIITTAGSPEQHLNGPAAGKIFNVGDVTTPSNTGKQDLTNKLVTTIFN
jgi:hypothetical protein